MERQTALVLSIVFFIIFTLITYIGAQVKIWSSIIFGLFISLVLLNIFYPPSQITTEGADATLVIYGTFQIVGIILILIFIVDKTLNDVRIKC